MMKLKLLSAAVATMAALATVSLGVGSASAATVNDVGSIGFAGTWTGTGEAESAPAATTLSFDELNTLFADGVFTGYEATSVNPLELVLLSESTVGDSVIAFYGIDDSYDGQAWKTYQDEFGNIITFDLDLDATWRRTFDLLDSDVNYEQDANMAGVFEYTGTYTLADGTTLFGRGELNASGTGTAQLFEITQTAAIPVPAAGLGLITGLGLLGALRRRRRQAAA